MLARRWFLIVVTILLFSGDSLADTERKPRKQKIKLSKEEKVQIQQFREDVNFCAEKKIDDTEKSCRKKFPFPENEPHPPRAYNDCVKAGNEQLTADCNKKMSKMLAPKLFVYWNSYYGPDGRRRKKGVTPGTRPGSYKRLGGGAAPDEKKPSKSVAGDWLTEFE